MSDTNPQILTIVVEHGAHGLQGYMKQLASADGLSVVAVATTGQEAIELVHEHHPRVLVMPTQLRDMPWLELVRELKDIVAILVVTHREHGGEVYDAMLEGARGCIMTWFNEIDLPDAVRRASDGQYVLGQHALREFVITTRSRHEEPTHARRMDRRKPTEDLTKRELEVLRHLPQFSYPEIATELGISVSTARTHGRNIRAKLGVDSTKAAVAKAHTLGLMEG